jgi:acetoin utilization protein AcuB
VKEKCDLTIDDFTTPFPVMVGPASTIVEAFTIMQEEGIRHLPVVDDGQVVGVVSDRDLRIYIGKEWSRRMTVGEIMQRSPMGVPVGTPLGEAAFLMASYKLGSLLVYDEQERLDGIFTDTDALNALVELTRGVGGRRLHR